MELLFGFAIIILLFFVFREIVMWYWKINEIVKLLTEIRDGLNPDKRAIEKPSANEIDDAQDMVDDIFKKLDKKN